MVFRYFQFLTQNLASDGLQVVFCEKYWQFCYSLNDGVFTRL